MRHDPTLAEHSYVRWSRSAASNPACQNLTDDSALGDRTR
jgi:hypothetical protein